MDRERLYELSRKSLVRCCIEVSITWILLISAIIAIKNVSNLFVLALLFVFISTQQYALLILMHDGLHGSLCTRRRINDFISQYFLSYPLGGLFFIGRDKHLEHHRTVGTINDPDLDFYMHENKSDHYSFLSYFFVTLLFMQVKYSFFNASTKQSVKLQRPKTDIQALATMTIIQSIILAIFWSYTGHWYFYLVFWFLPIITLTVFFDKVRIFCEHSPFQNEGRDSTAVLRTFRSSLLERFFLAPFDMNYHVEHHLYPGVPHQNLRKIHDALLLTKSNKKLSTYVAGSYIKFLWCYFMSLGKKI